MNSNEENQKESYSDQPTRKSTEDNPGVSKEINSEEPNYTIEEILIEIYNSNINQHKKDIKDQKEDDKEEIKIKREDIENISNIDKDD